MAGYSHLLKDAGKVFFNSLLKVTCPNSFPFLLVHVCLSVVVVVVVVAAVVVSSGEMDSHPV